MISCAHNFQPVEKCRAVYRCPACGAFAYKAKARTDIGKNEMQLYKCYHVGCAERVVVLYPVVKGKRRQQPSCSLHRRDK